MKAIFQFAFAFMVAFGCAPAQAQEYRYDGNVFTQPPGAILALDWCMRSATSKIGFINKGTCRQAAAKYGWNKSQKQLGIAAVTHLCRGESGRALDEVKACQCHNPGYWSLIVQTWDQGKAWAKGHPICLAVLKPPPPPPRAEQCVGNACSVVLVRKVRNCIVLENKGATLVEVNIGGHIYQLYGQSRLTPETVNGGCWRAIQQISANYR